MKFKLDENLSPSLSALFDAAGHEAHSVVEQALGGQPDECVIDVCRREGRVLVTLDLDFSNILTYPPAQFAGIVVFRLANQAHATAEAAIRRMLELVSREHSCPAGREETHDHGADDASSRWSALPFRCDTATALRIQV